MNPSDPPAQKKGLSGLAIFGIGCGAMLLIVVVAAIVMYVLFAPRGKRTAGHFRRNPMKAAAVLVVKADPEFELVKTDDARGEMTVRFKKTGEELTMSFEEIAQGKFRVQGKDEGINANSSGVTEDGHLVMKGPGEEETIIGDVEPPAWVPLYPGATPQPGGMRQQKKDSVSGAFTSRTPDPVAKVTGFFETKLKSGGFQTETNTTSADGTESAVVTGRQEAARRGVTVLISKESSWTNLTINYDEAKP
ncbi:MAG: hypothetical protein QOE70_3177 [Chthoniobacter sp.]|nr:hypothetical protein [Chthoniobacter sp.]